ncbi:MAG: threonylcarbamoyl-AMP synthase [Chloroflexi bacterium]|nr:threonylcarbamoyl-AMP synthase [Chloroflexota bacterium]
MERTNQEIPLYPPLKKGESRGALRVPPLDAALVEQLQEGVSILKQGGVIAFPTDTVYGLGAAINCPDGVQRVFAIKQRPADQALPVLLAGPEQIDEVATGITDTARRLARRFWPGALTLVLKKNPGVAAAVAGGGDTIGVRVPCHPVAVALVRGTGVPITGTSANLSGLSAGKTAAEVRDQIGSYVDYIIDAGPPPAGTESTIVDVTAEEPVILREGAISRSEIEKACLPER